MRHDTGNPNRYDDIIDLSHHVSQTHPQMPVSDRAAQFAPFAALTGYDAAVKETARLTEERIELEEYEKMVLNEKLLLLQEQLQKRPAATITFFQPDEKKAGGSYVTVSGNIKKIDAYEGRIVLMDGMKVPIADIIGLESELFVSMEN